MITITNIIKQKYYQYDPAEFIPVYSGDKLVNKKAFHSYKLRKAISRMARRFNHALQTAQR